MMPEMDGIETTERIRALTPVNSGGKYRGDNYYKNLPFIALTANAVSGMREMFIKNGFDDFLAKPIDVNIMSALLEKWLPKDKLETIEESDAAGTDLPTFKIEGIDVESGIYMTGGDARNYLKTLSIFRDDGLEKINIIRECCDVDDLHLYAIHVHALKSASASIGAAKVSNIARSLETAAKNNDRDFIVKNNERFIEELSMLLESIQLAVASTRATQKQQEIGEVDFEFVIEQAGKLREALDIFDMEEVDAVLALLKTQAEGEMDRIIEEISNSILICEYDKADELTKQLVELVNQGR
jgi:HPt (histidine-containing phosphotransfer) domain-containing protein